MSLQGILYLAYLNQFLMCCMPGLIEFAKFSLNIQTITLVSLEYKIADSPCDIVFRHIANDGRATGNSSHNTE